MPANNRRSPRLSKNARKSRRKKLWVVASILALLFSLAGVSIHYYNLLVNLQQNLKSIRGQIESSFQMRENLVPVLTSTVTDFTKHEDNVFTHTTATRANSIRGAGGTGAAVAGNEGWLSKLLAVGEQYPDLKSSEPFQLLMSKVADVETTIWEKRIEHNIIADKYNSTITSFPGFAYAFAFRFRKEPYFKGAGKPEWVFELNANQQFPEPH